MDYITEDFDESSDSDCNNMFSIGSDCESEIPEPEIQQPEPEPQHPELVLHRGRPKKTNLNPLQQRISDTKHAYYEKVKAKKAELYNTRSLFRYYKNKVQEQPIDKYLTKFHALEQKLQNFN
jgi:hypothetical protein